MPSGRSCSSRIEGCGASLASKLMSMSGNTISSQLWCFNTLRCSQKRVKCLVKSETSFPSAGRADGGHGTERYTTAFLLLRPGILWRCVVLSSVNSHRAHSLKRTHIDASLGERWCGKVGDRNAQRELRPHQAGLRIERIEGAFGIQAVERVTSHDGRQRDLAKRVPIHLQRRSWRVQDASQAIEARDKDL